jgi:hypothetical protein
MYYIGLKTIQYKFIRGKRVAADPHTIQIIPYSQYWAGILILFLNLLVNRNNMTWIGMSTVTQITPEAINIPNPHLIHFTFQ